MRIIVTGVTGFIGSHLAKRLSEDGHEVYGIDNKPLENWEHQSWDRFCQQFYLIDLTNQGACQRTFRDIAIDGKVDRIYHLAANMGGIGFIEKYKGIIVRDNTLININTIEAAKEIEANRFLFTSSACVYPGYLQKSEDITPLVESNAYPADAEDGYGWEKLYMERTCRHYREDFGLDTRIVRFHNIFGPHGTWNGGREKAPAAICRKMAEDNQGQIEIWGDGKQTRSFLYIDDCIEGLLKIMEAEYRDPLNLGQDRLISINDLVSIVEEIAGKKLTRKYSLNAPQGVRGRNSDNTLITEVTGWTPKVSLEEGLRKTYHWIAEQIANTKKA